MFQRLLPLHENDFMLALVCKSGNFCRNFFLFDHKLLSKIFSVNHGLWNI